MFRRELIVHFVIWLQRTEIPPIVVEVAVAPVSRTNISTIIEVVDDPVFPRTVEALVQQPRQPVTTLVNHVTQHPTWDVVPSMEQLLEARGVVDRVAGAGVPMIPRLGDDLLARPDGLPAPLAAERTMRTLEARLQASPHGVDVSGGHAPTVGPWLFNACGTRVENS